MNKFLAILALASVTIAEVNAQACPEIITRAEWGARDARWTWLPVRPAPFVVVHHTIAGVNAQACPDIITRAEWDARDARWTWLPVRPAPFVVVHHTNDAPCRTQNTCSGQMRAIQNMHMNDKGWEDVGYNFCVGGDGLVFQGRGWGTLGAHTPGYNHQSFGICFLGTYTTLLPTLGARNNAQALIRCGVSSGHIAANYTLIAHRQAVATECPGTALFNEMQNWPRFNATIRPV